MWKGVSREFKFEYEQNRSSGCEVTEVMTKVVFLSKSIKVLFNFFLVNLRFSAEMFDANLDMPSITKLGSNSLFSSSNFVLMCNLLSYMFIKIQ